MASTNGGIDLSFEYTKYGRELLKELNRQVLTLYSRQDVEFQCREYESAFSDERPSIENKLREIFRARGLDFNAFINANVSDKAEILSAFPDRESIKADFVRNFYALFSKITPSWRLIERLLENYACQNDRLLFEDGDTPRLKILKIFAAHSANDFDEVKKILNAMGINRIKDDTFDKLFSEQAWVSWLERRPEYKLLQAAQTFNLSEEQLFKIEAGNERVVERALAETEMKFCEWLSDFFEVVDGEKRTRRDNLYKSAKAKLIDDKFCISTASVKELATFLLNVIGDNDFVLPEKLQRKVITAFKLNGTLLKAKDLLFAILNGGAGSIKATQSRMSLLVRIKAAVQQDCLLGSSCGLDLKDWAEFFLEQTKTNKPVAPPSDEKNYDAVIAYLKQFKSGTTTCGHVVRDAWRIKNDTVFKRADNLANLRMGGLQRSTKRDFYRLVLLLDLHDVAVFESLLADLYTDNVLTESDFVNDSSVLAEGVNFKNFAEAIYLYFLVNGETKERLVAAERMIEDMAQYTREKTPASTDLTVTYEEIFFSILDLAPDDFQQRLRENYVLNVPRNTSPMIVASQTNSAVKACRELAQTLQNVVEGRDLDCGTDILDLLESTSFNDSRFVSILQNMARSLNVYSRNLLNDVASTDKISRTDAMALYFSYFVNKRLPNLLWSHKFVNWVDLVHEFTSKLDEHLKDCGYMTFNVKLAYDNFMLLALFLYVVDELSI